MAENAENSEAKELSVDRSWMIKRNDVVLHDRN